VSGTRSPAPLGVSSDMPATVRTEIAHGLDIVQVKVSERLPRRALVGPSDRVGGDVDAPLRRRPQEEQRAEGHRVGVSGPDGAI
jgi:hypothetical protein